MKKKGHPIEETGQCHPAAVRVFRTPHGWGRINQVNLGRCLRLCESVYVCVCQPVCLPLCVCVYVCVCLPHQRFYWTTSDIVESGGTHRFALTADSGDRRLDGN